MNECWAVGRQNDAIRGRQDTVAARVRRAVSVGTRAARVRRVPPHCEGRGAVAGFHQGVESATNQHGTAEVTCSSNARAPCGMHYIPAPCSMHVVSVRYYALERSHLLNYVHMLVVGVLKP